MKKSLKVFAAVCSVAFFLGLSACSTGSDLDSEENSGSTSGGISGGTTTGGTTGGTTTGGTTDGTTTGGGTSGSHTTSQVIKSGLKFDFSNAKAIAAVDKDSSGRASYSINSRAATPNSSVDDSPLLKILEDGKFESALTLADNANLANIKEIYKSPLEDSNDIFIVFDGISSFYDEQVTVDENGNTVSSNSVYKTLGQLVCIHEDNTIADILKINDSENSWDSYQNYLSLETDKGVMFDAAGNLYYMARTWNGNMSVVYKFEPKTDEITELTASVSGTNYSSFKITKDGKIIFVQGSRYSSGSYATFLRAIPVDNPNSFSNIYYSSNDRIRVNNWIYDEENKVIYYEVRRDDGKPGEGIYKAERNEDYFKTGELIGFDICVNVNQFMHNFLEKLSNSTDYSTILKDAFKICYTHGKKEFRLATFKNDKIYGDLYSELTDEAALKWIAEDDNRLSHFRDAVYNTNYKNFTDFFFIKDTNEPVYKQPQIKNTASCVWWYAPSDSYPIQIISYSSFNDYIINTDGSLWASCTNVSNSWDTGDKYFYFVQITDSDGCLINDFNEINLPEGMLSQTIKNDNGSLYMKYAVLNSNGTETGFHQIYKVNLSDGEYLNMFENVPNNGSLEVISYSVGADRLYYSAVRGTSVENGVVSTVTNKYNPLEVTKKLSAIYTF